MFLIDNTTTKNSVKFIKVATNNHRLISSERGVLFQSDICRGGHHPVCGGFFQPFSLETD